jgi:hypothetical protein
MSCYSKYVLALGIALICTNSAHATYIDSLGREWRDLTDTAGLTFNQVDAQCDDVTNLCLGSVTSVYLADIDLSGWTWASIDETQQVISEVTGLLIDGVNRFYQEASSVWGPTAISLFGNTEASDGEDNPWYEAAIGMTSTTSTYYTKEDGYPEVYLQAKIIDVVGPGGDLLYAPDHDLLYKDMVGVTSGVWMYRVPEPSAMLLLIIGLVGLGIAQVKAANRRSAQ